MNHIPCVVWQPLKQKECPASVRSHWLVLLHCVRKVRMFVFFLVASEQVQQNQMKSAISPQSPTGFKTCRFHSTRGNKAMSASEAWCPIYCRSKPPVLGTSWKCCLCIYQLHQRGGRVGDGAFVRERERGVGVGWGAALWSTQPHYSVDRTAHPLHCSSNQPKLTGFIWSPQNRTELQMRSPEWSAKSAVIAFF